MGITVTLLRKHDACEEGVRAFRATFPRGLTVASTPAGRARQAEKVARFDFDYLDFAADTFLPADARDTHYDAEDAAAAEYDRALAAVEHLKGGLHYVFAAAAAGDAYRLAIARALLDTFASLD